MKRKRQGEVVLVSHLPLHKLGRVACVQRLGRVGRYPPLALDELGPCVGEHEILDAVLGVVEHACSKALGDLAHVLGAILDGGDRGFGEVGVGGRRHAGVVEGSGRINLGLFVSVQDASGRFEDVIQLLEILGRNVDRKFGVAGADELGVDVQGPVEGFADHLLRHVVGRLVALAQRLGQKGLPLGDACEERDVLAGKVVEGGEALQGRRVAFEDVLEGAHVQDALAGAAVADDGLVVGFPAGHHRINHGGRRAERLAVRVGALGADLPLPDRLEGVLVQGLVTHDLPTREEDGEDFEEHNGNADPAPVRPISCTSTGDWDGRKGSSRRHTTEEESSKR